MQLAETSFDSYDYATTTELSGAQAAGLGAFLGAYFLFMLVFVVIMLVAMWKIFEKAGRPGWKALIPIYNYYIMLEIVGRPGWWLLLLFVPFVNLIVGILICLIWQKPSARTRYLPSLGSSYSHQLEH
jgi:cellulose synthase/poly-beta-1,6-N-acetylglucosamine synthase-like glycosyltransferase